MLQMDGEQTLEGNTLCITAGPATTWNPDGVVICSITFHESGPIYHIV